MALQLHLFFSCFGSHLLSDRNVPAGDDFVKIAVNIFPVLTQREELLKKKKTQQMSGKIDETFFFCAF